MLVFKKLCILFKVCCNITMKFIHRNAISPYQLALATLGGTTQLGSFLFYVATPKVAKTSKEGATLQAMQLVLANGSTA